MLLLKKGIIFENITKKYCLMLSFVMFRRDFRMEIKLIQITGRQLIVLQCKHLKRRFFLFFFCFFTMKEKTYLASSNIHVWI